MNKKLYRIVSILLIVFSALPAMANETAQQVLQATAQKLTAAKSIKAGFSMTGTGQKWTGTFLSKGAKFSLTLPGAGTWYDGKDIWSYSKASGEATVWRPTRSELAESNPFLYLSTASNYSVKFGSGASKGEQVIVLTPKTRGNSVKSVTVKINTSTKLPKSFEIAASGGIYTITVTSISLNQTISDSSFKFNKANYPGVAISDLR